MRYARQNKILELIKENDIDTQEMLVALLRRAALMSLRQPSPEISRSFIW